MEVNLKLKHTQRHIICKRISNPCLMVQFGQCLFFVLPGQPNSSSFFTTHLTSPFPILSLVLLKHFWKEVLESQRPYSIQPRCLSLKKLELQTVYPIFPAPQKESQYQVNYVLNSLICDFF